MFAFVKRVAFCGFFCKKFVVFSSLVLRKTVEIVCKENCTACGKKIQENTKQMENKLFCNFWLFLLSLHEMIREPLLGIFVHLKQCQNMIKIEFYYHFLFQSWVILRVLEWANILSGVLGGPPYRLCLWELQIIEIKPAQRVECPFAKLFSYFSTFEGFKS